MEYISAFLFGVVGVGLGATLGIMFWISARKSQGHDSTEHAFGDW